MLLCQSLTMLHQSWTMQIERSQFILMNFDSLPLHFSREVAFAFLSFAHANTGKGYW